MNEQILFQAILTVAALTIAAFIFSIPRRIRDQKFKSENPDKKEGNFKEYYENGNLKYDYNLKDWKLNGTLTEYNEKGKIKFKGNFINDKPDGLHLCFYENGNLKSEYKWKKNATDFDSTCWDIEGNEIACNDAEIQYSFSKIKPKADKKVKRGEF